MLKTFVASHVFTMCLLESLFEIYDIYVHLPDHMRPHVAMICHDYAMIAVSERFHGYMTQ